MDQSLQTKTGQAPKENCFPMNSLSWNIRGIYAIGRKKCIHDNLDKARPSIVSFQKTKKETFSISYLDSISLNINFSWNYLPAKGSA
jgi:exonuclease III